MTESTWANRTRISAKLGPEHYKALLAYCREHDLSMNDALKRILQAYFKNTPPV